MNPTREPWRPGSTPSRAASRRRSGSPARWRWRRGRRPRRGLLTLAESGDHVVSSASLYGGTYNLLHYTLPKAGIEVTFVDDPDDLD